MQIDRIAHATDFSDESALAFMHALRLAVAARTRLDLLHVRAADGCNDWSSFPHVRETLVRWRMLDPGAAPGDVEPRVGVRISKVEIKDVDAQHGLSRFLMSHLPDVLVVATHGRQGINRWLRGSVSEQVARNTQIPTLMLGPDCRGFVDVESGAMRLRRVLVPVAASPLPNRALRAVDDLLQSVGASAAQIDFITVGESVRPVVDGSGRERPVETLTGRVVETILDEADRRQADLIAMTTAGPDGVLDALRGSTTSRVVAGATCPVLSVTAG